MNLWNDQDSEKNELLFNFSSSIHDDIELFNYDIECSKAHSRMLHSIGILNKSELKEIIEGLITIQLLYTNKEWDPLAFEYEDIHSAIEIKLTELIGETAGKLHTGRSRNDQVATDISLWLCDAIKSTIAQIIEFQNLLNERSKKFKSDLIPGYTHGQQAQPITLGYHLLTYYEMLERDKHRFKNIFNQLKECPLGSSAIAGSTLQLDRQMTAKALGFETPSRHAMDSISNRDHSLDYLHAISTCMMHLSRLAEEMILWCSNEWNWIKLDKKYLTGSSLMPNKRNPDYLELIRGKVGRCYGNYTSLMTTMKGLSLSYNRDLQEDKRPIFDSHKTLFSSLKIMKGIIESFTLNEKEKVINDHILATDLADQLVLKGIPFRQIHHKISHFVTKAMKEKRNLSSYSEEEVREILNLDASISLEILNLNNSLLKKVTLGSCSPFEIEKLIQKNQQMLGI